MIRRALLATTAVIGAALVLPPLWYAVFPEPAPELPAAGRRVEVAPGVRVNVIEAGAGPPVVLVHGHPGCAYDWTALIRAFGGRGHRVLAYDRVGYGHSDGRSNGSYTVDANAEELLALLATESLREATIVGWSYGGGVSIVAARKDPARMARLVLVGSVGPGIERREGPPELLVEFMVGPGLSWLARVPPLGRRVRASFTRLAFAPAPAPDGALRQMDANFGAPHTLETLRSEGRDLGGQADLDPGPIELPILVVQGDGDRLVPLSVAEELHRRGRRAELWVVPGGGHALPVTHAEPLAERIAAFAGGP